MSCIRPEIEDLLNLAEQKVADEDFFSSSPDEVKFTIYKPDEKTFIINKKHIRVHTRSGVCSFSIPLAYKEFDKASLIIDSAFQLKTSGNLKKIKKILEDIKAADE